MSTGGGTNPVWSRDERELFYLDRGGTLTAVPVRTSEAVFERGRGVKLFTAGLLSTEDARSAYDVAPDGRFLLIKEQAASTQAAGTPRMVVLLNFFEELKRLLPGD